MESLRDRPHPLRALRRRLLRTRAGLMNVPQMVGAWITSSFSSKWTILLVVNIFLLFVGMVMDAARPF